MDPRIQNLSYSSLLQLHSCPRRFQLDKLQAEREQVEDVESSITFSFGHIVGHGIQRTIEGVSESQILYEMFLMWKPDLYAENTRQIKSFWYGVFAVQKFAALHKSGFLQDYELVYHNGKAACELGFRITFPDGFKYRGYVDVVLRSKKDGKVIVLELKTSSATNLNPATYKNSAQAIGYSIVLDSLFPDLSAYEVLYLIYTTKNFEYTPLPFQKSYLQRALWIRELLLDLETIKLYEDAGIYPMRGESCYSFYRECHYLGICTLATETLTSEFNPETDLKVETYDVEITLQDLIDSQLRRTT